MLPDYRWVGVDRGLNGGVGLSEYTPIFYRHCELCPIASGNFWLTGRPVAPPRGAAAADPPAARPHRDLGPGSTTSQAAARSAAGAVAEGDDVTELLELVKYEPPVPIAMQGEVRAVHGATLHYDIENVKKYPDELRGGEPVVVTENCTALGAVWAGIPTTARSSPPKGMSDRGMALILNEANLNNLYVRTWRAHEAAFETARGLLAGADQPSTNMSSAWCTAGAFRTCTTASPTPRSGLFDAYVGEPPQGRHLAPDEIEKSLGDLFPLVPVLCRGPFSAAVLSGQTDGATALGGEHLREGVVVRPAAERESAESGG